MARPLMNHGIGDRKGGPTFFVRLSDSPKELSFVCHSTIESIISFFSTASFIIPYSYSVYMYTVIQFRYKLNKGRELWNGLYENRLTSFFYQYVIVHRIYFSLYFILLPICQNLLLRIKHENNEVCFPVYNMQLRPYIFKV